MFLIKNKKSKSSQQHFFDHWFQVSVGIRVEKGNFPVALILREHLSVRL